MSWLFPAYLAGLIGLLLPWILHRFSYTNPPEQLFPSKRFLEATTPPVARKRKLRHRILLALRALSLILLCVFFAQPWLSTSTSLAGQQQHHMIVVDKSLSMRTTGHWSAAIDEADELVDELGGGSAQLIVFDQEVSVLASSGEDAAVSDTAMRSPSRSCR